MHELISVSLEKLESCMKKEQERKLLLKVEKS